MLEPFRPNRGKLLQPIQRYRLLLCRLCRRKLLDPVKRHSLLLLLLLLL